MSSNATSSETATITFSGAFPQYRPTAGFLGSGGGGAASAAFADNRGFGGNGGNG